jgi:hypothetical protein
VGLAFIVEKPGTAWDNEDTNLTPFYHAIQIAHTSFEIDWQFQGSSRLGRTIVRGRRR